jgi:hypothetical protein
MLTFMHMNYVFARALARVSTILCVWCTSRVHVCARVFVCVRARVVCVVCVHMCVHVCLCMHVHVCVHECVCAHVCVCARVCCVLCACVCADRRILKARRRRMILPGMGRASESSDMVTA